MNMTKKQTLQLFEQRKVRTVWDDQEEKWYFSIIDVVSVLTDSDYQTARKYWKVLKGRLIKEGNETVTNCYQLKLQAEDGKMRLTDVADTEQLFCQGQRLSIARQTNRRSFIKKQTMSNKEPGYVYILTNPSFREDWVKELGC